MVHAKEYKHIIDLICFINKNAIKKDDVISIGTKNNSMGDGTIPDFYYIIFQSERDKFEEVPVKLTV